MINKRAYDQRSAENAKIEQKKEIALLRQVDLQTFPHSRQAKNGPQYREHNSEYENATASAEEKSWRLRLSAHGCRFSERS
jgi:hypothetical protein